MVDRVDVKPGIVRKIFCVEASRASTSSVCRDGSTVLALLAEHPGMSNAEPARRNFVAAPTMLRILDGLTRSGFITRDAASPEQRVRRTVLTGTGSARLAAATAHVQEFEDLLVGSAAPGQVETIMTWLRTCAEKLGDRAIL